MSCASRDGVRCSNLKAHSDGCIGALTWKEWIEMGAFIESVGLSHFLMAIHYVPLVLAAVFWFNRKVQQSETSPIADALGGLGLVVVVFLYFMISNDKLEGSDGSPAQWFVILSFLTAGTLPVVSITLHLFAGRLIGRGIKNFRDSR